MVKISMVSPEFGEFRSRNFEYGIPGIRNSPGILKNYTDKKNVYQ